MKSEALETRRPCALYRYSSETAQFRKEKVGCSIHLSGTNKRKKPAMKFMAGFFFGRHRAASGLTLP